MSAYKIGSVGKSTIITLSLPFSLSLFLSRYHTHKHTHAHSLTVPLSPEDFIVRLGNRRKLCVQSWKHFSRCFPFIPLPKIPSHFVIVPTLSSNRFLFLGLVYAALSFRSVRVKPGRVYDLSRHERQSREHSCLSDMLKNI